MVGKEKEEDAAKYISPLNLVPAATVFEIAEIFALN
jgi:hypothetical protein